MSDTTLPGLMLTGTHAARPSATAVGTGALYSCTTHSLIYQSLAGSWGTWANLAGTGMTNPMTTTGDIIYSSSGSTPARLAVGSATQVLHGGSSVPAYSAVLPADLDVSADNTTADATTGHHGLLPKLGGGTSNYLRADGSWAAPSGSGSGILVSSARVRATGGNKTVSSTSWANLDTAMDLTVAAAAGDIAVLQMSGMWQDEASFAFIDAATLVSSTLTNWVGSGEPTTTSGSGVSGWHHSSNGGYQALSGSIDYVIQSGDISGGNVVFRLRWRNGGVNVVLRANSTEPLDFQIKVFRP